MCDNKKLKIIPTPQYAECNFDNGFSIKSVFVCSGLTDKIKKSLALLEKEAKFEIVSTFDAELIISSDLSLIPQEYLSKEDYDLFENKNAKEQGYVLKHKKGMPVIIAAMSESGCMYGISTLIQMMETDVSEFVIRDYPSFRYRGNKWLIWAETGIWSYDFGDGIEKYKERIIRKLDMSLKYKINVIYFDGFGFDSERYPEYKGLMKTLNREARLRGIHLMVGGYSMGYGMVGCGEGVYQGKAFMNRKSYPDGEVYPCIGTYDEVDFADANKTETNAGVMGREYGTCISNKALMDEKLKELKKYLVDTQAGGLYLHNMDAHEVHEPLWLARCDECRRRWPNDDLYAKDGAAGAFAYFFEELNRELKSVKTDDYDASEDLLTMFVSPGYLYADITSDETFNKNKKFWAKVSEYFHKDNGITIGFRELFHNHTGNVRRMEELGREMENCDSVVMYFSGSDGFYSDKLFIISAIFTYMFKEANAIICANGNAFQEPLQVINAEYMWNVENSSFYNLDDKPDNYKDFMDLYNKCLKTEFRPDEIYGKGGLLDTICTKLYGVKAGPEMADLYRLRGKNFEAPIPTACNVEIYTNYTKIIFPMRWDNEITNQEIIDMRERFSESNLVTKQAYDILKAIVENGDIDTDAESDLIWLKDSFYMGMNLTEFLSRYMCIYEKISNHFSDNRDLPDDIENELAKLNEDVSEFTTYLESLNLKPIDVLGGAIVRRDVMMDFLTYNISLMQSSIRTNKRIPDDRRELPKKSWW